MRIAVIAADLLPDRLGGAEVHVVELIQRLVERGHAFDVFVGSSVEITKAFPKNVAVHPVSYPKISNLYGLSYIMFAPNQIKRLLRGRDIDLLWAKQVFPQGVVAAILARHLKRPLYMTAQNPLDYKEELVMKGPIPFKQVWPNVLTPLVSFALQRADVVACVSQYAQEQAKKLGARRTVIIPNGVDPSKFKVESAKVNVKRRMKIISTSALIPRNGLDTLIDAVALLPKSINWQLVIAGDGPELRKLKALSSQRKIEGNVKFMGRIRNRDIPQFLSQADLFVRLSRFEGFGLSLLEAMAAGVPVVTTSVGGIPDFVRNEETGLLVNPNRPREAARVMRQLLSDEQLYRKIQTNAKILVKESYNWNTIASHVEQVFQTLA